MMSLSTKLNNATKLSPGNTKGVTSVADKSLERYEFRGLFDCSRYLNRKINILLLQLTKNPELILIFVSALCVFFALLSLRAIDNNRLTSWQWVFSDLNLINFTVLLVGSLLISIRLSAVSISRSYAIHILFVLSFFSVIPHWSSPEIIVDAARYFTQAKLLELNGVTYFLNQWGSSIAAWTDLPLIPFIYGIAFNIFDESRLSIQVINTLFFSFTVVITYFIGKELWGHRVGLYGAVMLLGIPYLYTQVPLMMVDIPSMFFLTLAVFLYIKSLSRSCVKTASVAAVSIAMAMLAKYSNWLMLSVLPVVFIVLISAEESKIKRHMMFRQTAWVVAFLSFSVILVMLWKFEIFYEQLQLLFSYQLGALSGWTESYASTFFFQVHPFVTIAALCSLYLSYRKKDYRFMIIAWMLVLIISLDIKRIRYTLIVFPMLALMAGYAFSYIENEIIRRYLAISIIVSTCLISMCGYKIFLEGSSASNISNAGKYIDTLKVEQVEVVPLLQRESSISPVVNIPLLDLFTKKPIVLSEESLSFVSHNPVAVEKSPFRFSWEYELPGFYKTINKHKNKAIVIILGKSEQSVPKYLQYKLDGFFRDKRFDDQDGIFRYSTIVDIYLPLEMQEKSTTL